MSHTSPARVLIVDDDPYFARQAKRALAESADVCVAPDRAAALAATEAWAPDVLIVDATLGDGGAFGLLDEMRDRRQDAAPRVLYLAKGPGSIQRFHADGLTFLGVIRRESGMDGLITAVRYALGVAITGSMLIA